MKRRNILIWMCILGLVFSVAGATAEDVELLTLDYQGTGYTAPIPENITLLFLNSENNNQTDVSVIFENHPGENVTFLGFRSENITYDWQFVNNTKAYRFVNVLGGTKIYIVNVDYSSIQVPNPPWQALIDQLNEVNTTVVNLTEQINNLTVNNSELNSLVSTYSSRLSGLQTDYDTLVINYNTYKEDTRVLIEGYYSLVNETINKSFTISRLETDIFNLEKEIDNLEKALEEVTNTWSTGYTKDGTGFFYFNSAWFIIGGLVFILIAFLLYSFRLGTFPFNSMPFLRSKYAETDEPSEITEKDRKTAIYEEIPEIEKTVLTPAESRTADDEIVSKSRLPVGQASEEPNRAEPKKPVNKKVSWWDTPEGMAKRQELKDRMKDINKRREEA